MNSEQAVIERDQKYVVPTYKRSRFVVDHGEGVYLYDTSGKRYLDFVAGIAVNALGYGDPEILAAIEQQARRLIHVSNLYLTEPQTVLAEMLVQNSFADKVFFCNSGAEANEAAIKFARKWGRRNGGDRYEIIAFSGAFHGRTMGALAATPREHYQAPYRPLLPGVVIAEYNNLASARAAVSERTCAIIVEPIEGEGGILPATAEFLQGLRELCNERHLLLICDEVQCGLGRSGTLWAYEQSGIKPDVMTIAKPLAGGLPMGATLVTEDVASAIAQGDHGSTFAAGPLVSSVAQVVVRRVSQPSFLAHVREVGEYLGAGLRRLAQHKPIVSEVRGRGLMWAIELTEDAAPYVTKGYEQGVIMTMAGQKVLRLLPPLVIQRQHVDDFLAVLDGVLPGGAE